MARPDDGLLQDQAGVTKRRGCLAASEVDGGLEAGPVGDEAYALAAAASRGLDHHRKADGLSLGREAGGGLVLAGIAGDARHAGGGGQRLRGRLVAHGGDAVGGGADKDQAGVDAGLCQRRLLRQEAVAGMDGVGAKHAGGLDQALDHEVAVARGGGADAHRRVGATDVQGARVREHRHRADAHAAAGADDAAGDLAAVGDEQGADHRITSGRRGGCPARTARARPAPGTGRARRGSVRGR